MHFYFFCRIRRVKSKEHHLVSDTIKKMVIKSLSDCILSSVDVVIAVFSS